MIQNDEKKKNQIFAAETKNVAVGQTCAEVERWHRS